MNYNLTSYRNIIIDFSAMFVRLDPELTEQLTRHNNLLFSPTFECDCRHFLKSVPSRVKDIYWSNVNAIRFSPNHVCRTWGVTDTFGLAQHFSSCKEPTLVIEANLTLEDHMIFSGIHVDVYSWDKEQIIHPAQFANEQKQRKISKEKDPLPFYEVTAGDIVYTETGRYSLSGDPGTIGYGTESNIFNILGHSTLLAKIYKLDEASFDDENVLTKQKLQNIIDLQDLGEDWGVDWLALPKAVLYADAALTKPVGYLMKKISGQFLSENRLFSSGNIKEKFTASDATCVRDVLDMCIRFVSQYMFLSANGIGVTDYNLKNFTLETVGNQSYFNMIDTDSFCYDEYISDCMTFAGSLTRKYECNQKSDLLNICEESLFVFIFTLLVLDPDYKPTWKRKFRFTKEDIQNYTETGKTTDLIKWKSIPVNLQNLYRDVFVNQRIPSASILLYELDAASGQPFAATRYADLYSPLLDLKKDSGHKTDSTKTTTSKSKQSTQQTGKTATAVPPKPATKTKKKKKSAFGRFLRVAILLLLGILFLRFLFENGFPPQGNFIDYLINFIYSIIDTFGLYITPFLQSTLS